MNLTSIMLTLLVLTLLAHGTSCTPSASSEELEQLGTTDLRIKDQPFRLWVADDFSEQSRGLMYVTAERMAPLPDGTQRGMIFVFDHERELSFWMRNTIIPLDIAYLDSSGNVVKTYTMAPLDDRPGQYPSIDPARFAIEVSAGTFNRIGLQEGDNISIPPTHLKRTP